MNIELKDAGRMTLPAGVMDLDVARDGRWLYAACHDGIYRVGLAEGESERIGQHTSWVSGIALVDEDRRLVTAGYDGQLLFRDLAHTEPVHTKSAHSFWSWRMAASPDRRRVASVSGQYLAGGLKYEPQPADEPTVKVFDAVTGERQQAFDLLPSVQAVAFDPSGQFVAAGNLMGDVAVWELQSGEQLAHWRTPDFTSWGIIKSHCYIGGIYALQFAPDGQSLYAAGMGEMRDPMAGNGRQLWQRFAWRETPPKKLAETVQDEAGEGLMETLAMHPSGEWFVMAGRLRGGDWNVGLFSVASGARVGFLKTGVRVTSARFSHDGGRLYLGGMDNQPDPKKGQWPEFGVIDRYDVDLTEKAVDATEQVEASAASVQD